MNALLTNPLQSLTGLAEHGRVFFDALSLHAPGSISAVAVLALCSTAAVVVLDASRRTLAVPTWSYLRRDIAQLAADRDGKRGLVLLRHERVWCGGPRKWVAQHGHLSRLWARATVSLRRMVAIEFGTCRSGRIGGAAGSITRGKANRFELRGGRS